MDFFGLKINKITSFLLLSFFKVVKASQGSKHARMDRKHIQRFREILGKKKHRKSNSCRTKS